MIKAIAYEDVGRLQPSLRPAVARMVRLIPPAVNTSID
jgi:hypothetical protein